MFVRLLLGIKKFLDRALEIALIVAMAVLTVNVLWGVFTRYVLGAQADWTQTLATSLLIWVTMFGGALAYGENAHLGIDYFVGKLDTSAQRLVGMAVHALILLFAIGVMLYGGYILVVRTLQTGQMVPGLQWQRGYVYLAVPISGVFFVIYAIRGLILGARPRQEETASLEID